MIKTFLILEKLRYGLDLFNADPQNLELLYCGYRYSINLQIDFIRMVNVPSQKLKEALIKT